jgi:protein-disulfide isomerase
MSNSKKKSGVSGSGKKPAPSQPTTPAKSITTTTSTTTASNARATKERREERKQQERRQRNTVLVIAVVVFVVVVAGIYLISNLPQEAPIPDGTIERYVGIPQTANIDNGMPMLGDPNAPIQVVSYTSYACPSCKDFHNAVSDVILKLIREGIMSYTIVPQENGEIPNGNGAARGALCAAAQGKFFEYSDVLFSWQEIYANQAFSQARMFAGAEALGMDVGQFRSCIGSSDTYALYNRASELRVQRGITGTPRTFIQGTEYTGGNSPSMFEAQVRQAYQQSGRIAVPLPTLVPDVPSVDVTPDATPVDESTAEPTAEMTPQAESTPES